MATPDEIFEQLGKAMLDLLSILDGRNHGIYRGTAEAVLAEAQGAKIGPDGFSHITSLRQYLIAVETRQDALEDALNRVGSIDSGLCQRIRQIMSPLLNQSSQITETLEETERMAVDLARTNPNRFRDVLFGQGGLGADLARNPRALVTTQIQQSAGQLLSRGIEPRLIPSLQAGGAQLLDRIRQLPTTFNDAVNNLLATLSAMRFLITRAAMQAGRIGLAVLTDALATIGEVLAAIGSRLVFIPIVIDLEKLLHGDGPSA